MKVLICAIAKNENLYIKEWVEYYKNIGVTRIVLYDNNDPDGENFNSVIGKHIESGFVEVVDYRGKHKSFNESYAKKTLNHGIQQEAYEDCYDRYKKDYDWFGFFDIDEFLHIDGGKNIQQFLSSDKFKNIDAIQFNWKCFGDGGHLRYENKPVRERFKKPSKYQSQHVKTIVRGNRNVKSIPCHIVKIENGKYVYPDGKKTKCDFKQPISLKDAYIEHYVTKTIEEWCDRKFNTTSATGKDYFNSNIESRIRIFFLHNDVTESKKKIINEKKNEIRKNKPRPIVSLTSYKKRFPNLIKVFDSIYANTIKPEKIVLTIETRDYKNIPKNLMEYIKKHNIEVIKYDENLKCHLKYFCTMKKYKNTPIITIDDDVIYSKDLIESLVDAYMFNKNCVCARRVHKITYNTDGTIKQYGDWKKEYKKDLMPSFDLLATGVGGVLYPPDILKISDENLPGIRKCLTADDIYLKYLEDEYKIPVLWVKNNEVHGKQKIKENQEMALWKTNVARKQNDREIKKLINKHAGKKATEKKEGTDKQTTQMQNKNNYASVFFSLDTLGNTQVKIIQKKQKKSLPKKRKQTANNPKSSLFGTFRDFPGTGGY